MKKLGKKLSFAVPFFVMLLSYSTAYAMHVMEGFLPKMWAAVWWIASIPFLFLGIRKLTKTMNEGKDTKMILGLVGGFTFILSALKLPSVTGSCSHPTGVGLGAVLFGPLPMVVIGGIVLLFQALLLAHGGLTTLGANMFSMAIVGPFVSYGIYQALKKTNKKVAVFCAAALGDLLTYVTTSVQLALAVPDPTGGFAASFAKFSSIFAITQIPLAIAEGLLTVVIFILIEQYQKEGVLDIAKAI